MELEDRIVSQFHNSMEINAITIEQYTPLIAHAGELLLHCLVSEGKILCCANGASSSLGQHFTSLLMNRFSHERPGLPAINLNSDGSTLSGICEDSSFMEAQAKQIHALGQPGDILLLITPHGRSSSLVQAIQAAHDRDMTIIVLNGSDGGDITALLSPEEIEICVPSDDHALVHHAQLLVIHALCDLIDYQLFGSE
ncbi:SIS domain-containing protein [Neptuniibacter caesariensis]|uniref:Phosphoheptose isomerase n=1 Tax=Neptuniibacter caesariensis TaxID=207954 RepID=A0A7U8C1D9_NEPCE|nr:SIS domain-containing protein [Neptuniibacter caesariensis]EAR59730.1 Phosphoheptose isomerase [Oceanospirillum sp. MED92] [Neptuniibacter caesariensis]